jgi:oxygen-independent coproporphyrinogen-3 oxidase
MDRYLRCLEEEWHLRRCDFRPAETIYFGGGTPGLLSCGDFARLAALLTAAGDRRPREWTVEFSPATVREEKLQLLRRCGVTRISLGVQSFDDRTLAALGRRQTAAQALGAYEMIRGHGFSVSLDLIFQAPGQTLGEWRRDLDRAATLEPDHLSTYCLTEEPDAPLWRGRSGGGSDRADCGMAFYEIAWNFLRGKGFEHYEVSNFCRPGHRCLHNCNCWRMGEWLGLGPAAASQCRGRRFRNVAHLSRWADGICGGVPKEEDCVELTELLLLQDRLIFGLRTRDGIHRSLLDRAALLGCGALLPLFEKFLRSGFLFRDGDWLRPTDRGLLLADAMALEILCHCA